MPSPSLLANLLFSIPLSIFISIGWLRIHKTPSARNRSTSSLDSLSNKQHHFSKCYNASSSSFCPNRLWLSKATLHVVLMTSILSPFQFERLFPFPTANSSCILFSSHKQHIGHTETKYSAITHNHNTPLFISDTYGKHTHNSQLETITLLLSKQRTNTTPAKHQLKHCQSTKRSMQTNTGMNPRWEIQTEE